MCENIQKKKRGAKQRYNDPIHEAWRLISRDRYEKNKIKRLNGEIEQCRQ
jgi:hypothetical protein